MQGGIMHFASILSLIFTLKMMIDSIRFEHLPLL
jgi:hypothetical protein